MQGQAKPRADGPPSTHPRIDLERLDLVDGFSTSDSNVRSVHCFFIRHFRLIDLEIDFVDPRVQFLRRLPKLVESTRLSGISSSWRR